MHNRSSRDRQDVPVQSSSTETVHQTISQVGREGDYIICVLTHVSSGMHTDNWLRSTVTVSSLNGSLR